MGYVCTFRVFGVNLESAYKLQLLCIDTCVPPNLYSYEKTEQYEFRDRTDALKLATTWLPTTDFQTHPPATFCTNREPEQSGQN
jgi:hypothetical protein